MCLFGIIWQFGASPGITSIPDILLFPRILKQFVERTITCVFIRVLLVLISTSQKESSLEKCFACLVLVNVCADYSVRVYLYGYATPF